MNNNKQMRNNNNQSSPAMPIGPGRAGRPGMGLVEKPKDFLATLKKIIVYLRPFWIGMIFVFLFAIAGTISAVVSPKILGNMTNQIISDYAFIREYRRIMSEIPDASVITPGITGKQLLAEASGILPKNIPSDILISLENLDFSVKHQINFNILRGFAIELLVLYIFSSIFNYIQGWMMSGIAQKISYRLRRDISKKINSLPLTYFDKRPFGEVLSHITNDVDIVSQTLNQSLTQIITSITMIVGILIIMLTISWQMTGISLVLTPLSIFFITFIVRKSQRYFKEQQDLLGEMNGHVEEMYSGHNIMRVFNGAQQSIAKFENINKKLFNSAWKSQFLSGLMWPIITFFGNLSFVGVSVFGGWLAINGKLRIGDIQAFIQYVGQFNQPIIQTANIANVLQSTAAAAERVFEFLEEEEEKSEDGKSSLSVSVVGDVQFKNVSFGYDKNNPVIKNFNVKIKSGQRIAIVGPTGAGKTTIVNLLMRFYDVDQGLIKIDGIDIRTIKRSDLRSLFSMVLQDTWLFNGTIRENIAYGKPGAALEEIVSAAHAAHADYFIHALPQGYDMQLNEEADNISQGEKQLLTIARAMLAKTPILILDEATSSVDTRTELLIQKAMENLMERKTSFVIAHRLSTIRNSDLILVMDKGNIVEQGKHEELLAKKGFYAALYHSQFVAGLSAAKKII